jgi:hypothetical protein
MLPYAVSARAGLATRLARMASYVDRARELATRLERLERVRVFPEPPHTNAFRLFIEAPVDAVEEANISAMEQDKIALLGWCRATEVPGWTMTELTVGDATLDWDVEEQVAALSALVDRARS